MRLALRIGGLLIAATIMYLLVDRLGAQEIITQLRQAGAGFLWILLMHVVGVSIAALPWYLLLPAPTRPTLGGAIASRFVAQGANAVLPMFGVGGELVRLLWLRPGERAPGVAAIVVDRLLYVASSVLVLAGGLVGLLHLATLPVAYTHAAALAIGVMIVVAVLGLLLAGRFRMAGRIHRTVMRMRKRLREGEQFGDEVDHHVERMLQRGARRLLPIIAIHFAGRVVISAEVVVGFYLLGVPLAWDEALVFAALPIMGSITAAVVPNQLGVHEGANALVAASLGISPATAVAVVLLLRLRQLAGVLLIGVLVVTRRDSLPTPSARGGTTS